MELLYLYVSKYKGLENKEFNFSSKYKIHYNIELKSLECVNDVDLPENFWAKNIRSVTGIIGKNGAGKTTLIRLLLQSCISEGLSDDPENVIVAYKERKNSKNISFYCNQSIELKSYPDFFQPEETSRLSDVSFIYHSNHFDPYTSFLDLTKDQLMGMINLGTNYLLKRDKETYSNVDYNSPEFTFQKSIDLHRAMELRRQINFIRKYRNEKEISYINVPDFLRISTNTVEESFLYNGDSKSIITISCREVSNVFNQIQETINKTNSNDLLVFKLFRASIFNIFNNLKALWDGETYLAQFTKMIITELHRSFENDNVISLNIYTEIYSKLENTFPLYISIGKNKNALEGLFLILKDAIFPKLADFCYIDLKKKNITQFNKFFDSYFSEERITSFLNFELSHNPLDLTTPSSGELAMFNFFSRFSSVKKQDLKPNIIILLDEVELALHPEWQRKYLNTILSFLENEFGGNRRNLQLIITSHSPFIVSDLPKCCINFLNGKLNSKETFGANIFSLFTDAFFLEDGLIGEFAKTKIFELLDEIDTKEISHSSKDRINKIIDIIGEPLIKERLLEKLLEKLDKSELSNKREQLLRELAEIDNQLSIKANEKG